MNLLITHPYFKEFIRFLGSGKNFTTNSELYNHGGNILTTILTGDINNNTETPIRFNQITKNIKKFAENNHLLFEYSDIPLNTENREEKIKNKITGFLFELFCELFLSESNLLELYNIKMTSEDYGVDAYAIRGVGGNKAAIQMKYRSNPKHILESGDMKNFLATAHANGVPYADNHVIIMTNLSTKNISRTYTNITKDGFANNSYNITVIGKEDIENEVNVGLSSGKNRILLHKMAERISNHIENILNPPKEEIIIEEFQTERGDDINHYIINVLPKIIKQHKSGKLDGITNRDKTILDDITKLIGDISEKTKIKLL